ncbi:MAG: orotidine-5'-phosphate decarboxylase [Clostridia bacterium]|jgi:orotidine-5'-phosphate decarboxylase|nr:orotidine-5'-phosphate decarboxylase [Clostridia bacterium]
METKGRLCLALDVDDKSTAERLVKQLSEYVGIFKIGFQIYTKEGPEIISAIKELGGEVFLDLKFHDIPNTIAQVSRIATSLGVSMFNLHVSGGKEMMKAAVQSAQEEADRLGFKKPKILGVTVLTSIDQPTLRNQLRINNSIEEHVKHLALLAQKAGLDGVIASPKETSIIRTTCGADFIIGTPGIRPPGSPPDDQKRTLTPREAIVAGATFIVVGRPIRKAKNPVQAAMRILEEIEIQ